MKINTKIKVRYSETDMMGIVYHANYYIWFEVGRTELLEKVGRPYHEMEKENLYLPVIKSSANYIKPAEYGDVLDLETEFLKIEGLKIYINYKLYRDGTLLVTGETVHTLLNKLWKPVRAPEWFASLFERK